MPLALCVLFDQDVRYLVSHKLFEGVWFLAACEREMLEDLSLFIEREGFAPAEMIPSNDCLNVLVQGVCSRGGVILTQGAFWGDAVINSPVLRNTKEAKALSYCEIAQVSRRAIIEVASKYPRSATTLRNAGLLLATKRGLVLTARIAQILNQRKANSPDGLKSRALWRNLKTKSSFGKREFGGNGFINAFRSSQLAKHQLTFQGQKPKLHPTIRPDDVLFAMHKANALRLGAAAQGAGADEFTGWRDIQYAEGRPAALAPRNDVTEEAVSNTAGQKSAFFNGASSTSHLDKFSAAGDNGPPKAQEGKVVSTVDMMEYLVEHSKRTSHAIESLRALMDSHESKRATAEAAFSSRIDALTATAEVAFSSRIDALTAMIDKMTEPKAHRRSRGHRSRHHTSPDKVGVVAAPQCDSVRTQGYTGSHTLDQQRGEQDPASCGQCAAPRIHSDTQDDIAPLSSPSRGSPCRANPQTHSSHQRSPGPPGDCGTYEA